MLSEIESNWVAIIVARRNSLKTSGYSRCPIDALSADYQVIPKKLAVPESLAGRTYGQKIEVTRRADGKVIAETQYYWDKEKRWECPAGISDSRFIERFVADSLNLPVSQ